MVILTPATSDFPGAAAALEEFGLKFTPGGPHISRTIMLAELAALFHAVARGSTALDYCEAIVVRNVLNKTTDSTKQKSLRHLRELYALDEATPVFGVLRMLHATDPGSLPMLAIQVAWARDPLLRATTLPMMDAAEGKPVETASLAQALEAAFPMRYSELSRNKIARNAASSWSQSGYLAGHTNKVRKRIAPSAAAVTLALFLGDMCGYHGAAIFSNPWCGLLGLAPERARGMGQEAHRAGLLDLRAVGEIVEVSFPRFAELRGRSA